MLPALGNKELEDLAMELAKKSCALAGTLHPAVRKSIGNLVRSMNCYYSNLIEGHDTHPRDIDKALAGDFSKDPEKRNSTPASVAREYPRRQLLQVVHQILVAHDSNKIFKLHGTQMQILNPTHWH